MALDYIGPSTEGRQQLKCKSVRVVNELAAQNPVLLGAVVYFTFPSEIVTNLRSTRACRIISFND